MHVLLGGSCPLDSCGPASPMMLASGRDLVTGVNRVRSSFTWRLPSRGFQSREVDFLTYIWIWWDPCPPVRGSATSLQWSTEPPAVPLSSITVESCTRAFISTWVSRLGVPALLTSDRGSQFTSSVWSEVCSILGISRILTISFHPQSNGMMERLLSMCLYVMMLRNLRCRPSTEVLTRFSDALRNFLFSRSGINLTPSLWTGWSLLSLVWFQPPSLSLRILLVFQRRKWGSQFRFLLRSSARILAGRFEVPHLSPPSSSLTFWGE